MVPFVTKGGGSGQPFGFYLPFNWRGFHDFGSGLIGDWGIHILGPANWALALGSEHAVNLEAALELILGNCADQPACKAAFGNPYRTLYTLRDQARATPIEVTLRDPLTHQPRKLRLDEGSVALIARLFAYAPETAALLPLLLDEAAKGRPESLVAQGAASDVEVLRLKRQVSDLRTAKHPRGLRPRQCCDQAKPPINFLGHVRASFLWGAKLPVHGIVLLSVDLRVLWNKNQVLYNS